LPSGRHADQFELLVVALDHPLGDLAKPRDVVLLLGLGLERAELARDQRVLGSGVWDLHARTAENTCLVESLTGWVVLLPVGVARPRIGRHDDAGLRAVYPRLPRIACLGEAAML